MDYGQTKITVLVSTGSDGYFQMNMRREGFWYSRRLRYPPPSSSYLVYTVNRAILTFFSETAEALD